MPPDFGAAAVRTAYGDDDAWQKTWDALVAPYPEPDMDWDGANLIPVESAELAALGLDAVAALPREGYHSAIVVIDDQSLRDHTAVVMSTSETDELRMLRTTPEQLQGILVNLSLGNMDLEEFLDYVGEDGVFRGFGE